MTSENSNSPELLQNVPLKWDIPAVAARLRQLVDGGGGPAEVARRTGVPLSTLMSYLNGGEMKFSRAALIAAATGTSLDWLATGEGSRMRGNQPATEPPTEEQVAAAADHAMKEMLPAEMTAQDKYDLLRVTGLAEDYLKVKMPRYSAGQVVIMAANFFAAMRKLPGSEDDQFNKLSDDIYRDIDELLQK